jgi:hypothetical protein
MCCAAAFAVVLLSAPPTRAAEPANAPLRILFVGNSYTQGSWPAIIEVFQADNPRHVLEQRSAGGATLDRWSQDARLRERIKDGKWDFVVLQEQSQFPSLTEPYVKKFSAAVGVLDELITKSDARTVLFMTWGRRDGDKQNAQLNPDFETMQARLSKSYRTAANEHEALLAPVGEAFARIKKDDAELFPKLYKNDGSHPALGGYAAAYCLFKTIRGETPSLQASRGARRSARPDAEVLKAILAATEKVAQPAAND